jgi:uncharacterized membrane protein
MDRLLATLLAGYGFVLSRQSTETIERLRREAQAGHVEAQQHFTQTRFARALGPRNSDLGMVFYAAVGLCAVTGLIRRPRILAGLLLGSALSIAVSLYLLWALFFRLRVWCSICMRGHAINLVLFALLVRRLRT